MPEKTIVHVMRHGEVHNPEQILYGRLPGYRLSPLGERMAEEVKLARRYLDIEQVRFGERLRGDRAKFVEVIDKAKIQLTP